MDEEIEVYISPLEEFANYVAEDPDIKSRSLTSEILVKLFDRLFYTSLRSEEGEQIEVTVTFFDKESRPIIGRRKATSGERWSYVPFKRKMALTVDNLVKLSKAADPWSSSVAVVADDSGGLRIYGLIDQALHQQTYINLEDDNKPDQPGVFQVSITGIGTLTVMKPGELIATLKQDKLITAYQNVFVKGPVARIIQDIADATDIKVKRHFLARDKDANDLEEIFSTSKIPFRNALSRILNKIKNYNHGGALLITDNYENENLDIKYELTYDRMEDAIKKYKINAIKSNFEISQFEEDDEEGESYALYRLKEEKQKIDKELKGAIRFIAAQSRVDGLIVLDKTFVARGFGAVIRVDPFKGEVYLATTPIPSGSMKTKDAAHWGTRHRTMFAYCNIYPESLGFVISQDGDVRAIKKVDDKLVIWENIRIQKL